MQLSWISTFTIIFALNTITYGYTIFPRNPEISIIDLSSDVIEPRIDQLNPYHNHIRRSLEHQFVTDRIGQYLDHHHRARRALQDQYETDQSIEYLNHHVDRSSLIDQYETDRNNDYLDYHRVRRSLQDQYDHNRAEEYLNLLNEELANHHQSDYNLDELHRIRRSPQNSNDVLVGPEGYYIIPRGRQPVNLSYTPVVRYKSTKTKRKKLFVPNLFG